MVSYPGIEAERAWPILKEQPCAVDQAFRLLFRFSINRTPIRRLTSGRPRLSQAGSAHIRAVLYMAAIVGTQHNPPIKALYQRLQARGKTKMSALGAAMRKLVHLCFDVLKTRQRYRPDYAI